MFILSRFRGLFITRGFQTVINHKDNTTLNNEFYLFESIFEVKRFIPFSFGQVSKLFLANIRSNLHRFTSGKVKREIDFDTWPLFMAKTF